MAVWIVLAALGTIFMVVSNVFHVIQVPTAQVLLSATQESATKATTLDGLPPNVQNAPLVGLVLLRTRVQLSAQKKHIRSSAP